MTSQKKDVFIITGGRRLSGKVRPSGAKNAALKMIASSLLGQGPIVIENAPKIVDVEIMLKLVGQFGINYVWHDRNTLELAPGRLSASLPQTKLVKKLRASFVLVGPMLARFQSAKIAFPGGDKIGLRPVTTHLEALKQIGTRISQSDGWFEFRIDNSDPRDRSVFLSQTSVTATENVLMASVLGESKVTIYGAALEPEIGNLIELLQSMGAKIEGKNTPTLKVVGQKKLGPGRVKIIPDRIETGTLAMAALATGGQVEILDCRPELSNYLIARLSQMNAQIKINNGTLIVASQKPLKSIKVDTRPYPGFNTDLQAPLAALLTQVEGSSRIFETMYERRFSYIQPLVQMGAKIKQISQHEIQITGPSSLIGRRVITNDIRAGAALIVAGLAAKGQTIVERVDLIDRGYQNLEEKLTLLGANIRRAPDQNLEG